MLKGEQLVSGFDAKSALSGQGDAMNQSQLEFITKEFIKEMAPSGMLDAFNKKLGLDADATPEQIYQQVKLDPGTLFSSSEFEVDDGGFFGGQDFEYNSRNPLHRQYLALINEARGGNVGR